MSLEDQLKNIKLSNLKKYSKDFLWGFGIAGAFNLIFENGGYAVKDIPQDVFWGVVVGTATYYINKDREVYNMKQKSIALGTGFALGGIVGGYLKSLM